MNIIVSHTSLVFEFINEKLNANKIYEGLIDIIFLKMAKNKFSVPKDWTLYFNAIYTNGKIPLASKNKLGSYASDKMKEISIVIPIPIIAEIEWGVNPEQHLYKKDHYDKLMKNFYALDVDYKNFDNRTDYITACMKAGIMKSFEEGFTVGGVKIKAKKPVIL